MEEVTHLLKQVKIPNMIRVKQSFDQKAIPRQNIQSVLEQALHQEPFSSYIRPGMRIAIPAGSRGIQNIDLILKTTADFVKQKGGIPFLFPAMGSHGGASAQGQKEILEEYGITETFCGCPVLSSMETAEIGKTPEGDSVFLDQYAAKADGIIVVCRVKAHTAFRGEYESGILKMMVIGMGKQKGAEQCHKEGFGRMAENIKRFGKVILEHTPIFFAVVIIENAFDETRDLIVCDGKDIWKKEPEFLKIATKAMPRIRIPECDVLIVNEIGKNFSGEGMDPNITGTFLTPYASGGIRSQRVVVLDISKNAYGNGYGIGSADCTTRRAVKKLDLQSMYVNGLTSTVLGGAKLPCIFENDKTAIQAAIKTCVNREADEIRVVRIANTLELEDILISESLLPEAEGHPHMKIESEPFSLLFDCCGNLIS